MKYELMDVFHVSENFDAATLVQRCWLHEPHILSAVLNWHSFFVGTAPLNFFVPARQQVNFIVITGS